MFKRPLPCLGRRVIPLRHRNMVVLGAIASIEEHSPLRPTESGGDDSEEQLAALWKMARPINFVPSFLLVLLGAWAACGKSFFLLAALEPRTWLRIVTTGFISASVAGASCILNDFFDFITGVDAINDPQKPLPLGLLSPQRALLTGGGVYMAVLMTACFLSQMPLRILIVASAVLTLIYTPVLKKMSVLKNAVVALTVALAPLAGALAASADGHGIHAIIKPCIFAFLGVMNREILMDLHDVEGDAQSGIKTLPVLVGRNVTLRICFALLASALSVGLYTVFTSPLRSMAVRLGTAGALVASLGQSALFLSRIRLEEGQLTSDGSDTLSKAIDETLKTIGLGIFVLAAMS